MPHNHYRFIDPRVLLRATADDLDAFRSLSHTFVEIAPPMLERLEAAILAGDRTVTADASHALKGCTVLVGAAQLTHMLDDIERLSRQATRGAVVPPDLELRRLFSMVMQEVRASIAHFQGDAWCGADPA